MIVVLFKGLWHIPKAEAQTFHLDSTVWWGTRCYADGSSAEWKKTGLRLAPVTCFWCLLESTAYLREYGRFPFTGVLAYLELPHVKEAAALAARAQADEEQPWPEDSSNT